MRFVRVGVFWRRDAVGLAGGRERGWGRGWRLGDVEVHRRWGEWGYGVGEREGRRRVVTEAVGGGRDCA